MTQEHVISRHACWVFVDADALRLERHWGTTVPCGVVASSVSDQSGSLYRLCLGVRASSLRPHCCTASYTWQKQIHFEDTAALKWTSDQWVRSGTNTKNTNPSCFFSTNSISGLWHTFVTHTLTHLMFSEWLSLIRNNYWMFVQVWNWTESQSI